MIRTRFAPSPTGELHLGGLRTALYSYALAKRHGGAFHLRIEDTDAARTVPGASERIETSMRACGLRHDGPVVRQSERLAVYRTVASGLVDENRAYACFCSKERLEGLRRAQTSENAASTRYDGKCSHLSREEANARIRNGEPHVIRMRAPTTGDTLVQDAVAGPVRFNNNIMDDQVLIKADGWPTYHLASVVDDHETQITHVVRGNEWLSSTPKHLALHAMLGWKPPTYAHLPLLMTPDGKKLSKRSEMGVPVLTLLEQGYLASGLINFVALLGWGPPPKYELVLSLEDIVREFSLDKVVKNAAAVDDDRLHWLNGAHMRRAVGVLTSSTPPPQDLLISHDAAELVKRVRRGLEEAGVSPAEITPPKLLSVLDLLKERAYVLPDFCRLGKHFFLPADQPLDLSGVPLPADGGDRKTQMRVLEAALDALRGGAEPSTLESLHDKLGVRKKDVLGTMRWALTGLAAGAPLPGTVRVLGVDVATKRLQGALKILDSHPT